MMQQCFEFGFCDERMASKSKLPSARNRGKSTQQAKPPESDKIKAQNLNIQKLKDKINDLKSINEHLLKQYYEVKKISSELQLQNQLLRVAMAGQKTSKGPIPADMLLRLIRLCHPDRHSNNEAANNATAWLLAQRKTQ